MEDIQNRLNRLTFTMARLNLLSTRDLPQTWLNKIEVKKGKGDVLTGVMRCERFIHCSAELIVHIGNCAGPVHLGQLVEPTWQSMEKARWRMYLTNPVCGSCGDEIARTIGGDEKHLARNELISLFNFDKNAAAKEIEAKIQTLLNDYHSNRGNSR